MNFIKAVAALREQGGDEPYYICRVNPTLDKRHIQMNYFSKLICGYKEEYIPSVEDILARDWEFRSVR